MSLAFADDRQRRWHHEANEITASAWLRAKAHGRNSAERFEIYEREMHRMRLRLWAEELTREMARVAPSILTAGLAVLVGFLN